MRGLPFHEAHTGAAEAVGARNQRRHRFGDAVDILGKHILHPRDAFAEPAICILPGNHAGRHLIDETANAIIPRRTVPGAETADYAGAAGVISRIAGRKHLIDPHRVVERSGPFAEDLHGALVAGRVEAQLQMLVEAVLEAAARGIERPGSGMKINAADRQSRRRHRPVHGADIHEIPRAGGSDIVPAAVAGSQIHQPGNDGVAVTLIVIAAVARADPFVLAICCFPLRHIMGYATAVIVEAVMGRQMAGDVQPFIECLGDFVLESGEMLRFKWRPGTEGKGLAVPLRVGEGQWRYKGQVRGRMSSITPSSSSSGVKMTSSPTATGSA